MKIDIHTHILPPDLPDYDEKFGYKGFLKLHHHSPGKAMMVKEGKMFREIEANCWDPAVRLLECDSHGVDVQVLSTIPVLFNYWAVPEDCLEVCRTLNDHIAETVRLHPKRFIGLGTLPLQDAELAIGELERCVNELGLAGIEIGTHINEWNLDDPNLFPVLEAAQDLGAAVFVHPWDMRGAATIQKYWLPWLVAMPFETAIAISSLIFGGVLEKLPKLRIAFAHGGGSFGCLIGRIQHGFECRPDLCHVNDIQPPKDYLGRFWVDSLVHDQDALKDLIRIYGEDKVILGSDYPFPLGEQVPGTLIDAMGYAPELRERLLSVNALDWLRRPKADFLRAA
ncbi:MAG: 2-amino-3-carboxymuconate-6-semialdehyde decarboxylase [Candidatus Melainabacteria bacterium HGW-Melainabacteria-1]|nr:MAG: 2-amino-3-carboxymuconate-6-semialdehyde decarboxylase [Candidatus Melainabacteria bacterium HGW-Melainabacteria-1]